MTWVRVYAPESPPLRPGPTSSATSDVSARPLDPLCDTMLLRIGTIMTGECAAASAPPPRSADLGVRPMPAELLQAVGTHLKSKQTEGLFFFCSASRFCAFLRPKAVLFSSAFLCDAEMQSTCWLCISAMTVDFDTNSAQVRSVHFDRNSTQYTSSCITISYNHDPSTRLDLTRDAASLNPVKTIVCVCGGGGP